jgi:deoxyribose-phosphate aldolase
VSAEIAARALPLVDLTSLNEEDDEGVIAALCERAVTPAGAVAAVCVYPRFVAQARSALAGSGVRIATVANFPAGATDAAPVRAEAEQALADGADEVDVVLPYEAYLAGDRQAALAVVDAVREACGSGARMKVILESGALEDPEVVRAAAADALAHGADFVKTSTGKRKPGATLPAAEAMLLAIRDAGGTGGFKASGGISTTEDAGRYLALADSILGPGFVAPERFRFGASSLLGALLESLGHSSPTAAGGY